MARDLLSLLIFEFKADLSSKILIGFSGKNKEEFSPWGFEFDSDLPFRFGLLCGRMLRRKGGRSLARSTRHPGEILKGREQEA
jgi:hypothetical protein